MPLFKKVNVRECRATFGTVGKKSGEKIRHRGARQAIEVPVESIIGAGPPVTNRHNILTVTTLWRM